MSARCSGWVWEHAKVKSGELVVLLALADYAHDDGEGSFPSQETLARKSRMSARQVRNCLTSLEEKGAIRRTGITVGGVVMWAINMGAEDSSARQSTSGGVGSLLPTEPSVEPELLGCNGEGAKDVGTQNGASGLKALTLTVEGEGDEKDETPCWDLSPSDERWAPSYTAVNADLIEIAIENDCPWAVPPPERIVFDFWRDLHWHMEAALTPLRAEAIRTALKHYDIQMVCRAIAAGLTDRWIQGEEGEEPHDKLETMIAVTSKRDNVDRLGHQMSESGLMERLVDADANRRGMTCWRLELFDQVGERWRFDNRKRLERDGSGRYRRYMAWSRERDAAAAA